MTTLSTKWELRSAKVKTTSSLHRRMYIGMLTHMHKVAQDPVHCFRFHWHAHALNHNCVLRSATRAHHHHRHDNRDPELHRKWTSLRENSEQVCTEREKTFLNGVESVIPHSHTLTPPVFLSACAVLTATSHVNGTRFDATVNITWCTPSRCCVLRCRAPCRPR